MSNQKVHIVFGEAEDSKQAEFDTDEVKETHWISADDVKQLIMKNEITDGISLMPLLFYFSGMVSKNEHIVN